MADNDAIAIARLGDRTATVEEKTTELWKQFNSHRNENVKEFDYIKNHLKTDMQTHILRRANEYTDNQIKISSLQMSIDHQELAKEISANLKQDAWSIAKVVDYVFRIGVLVGMGWLGIQTARAATPESHVESVGLFSYIYAASAWFGFAVVSFGLLIKLKGMHERDELPKWATYAGYITAAIWYVVIDIGGNLCFMTIFLLDVPQEFTLTARLKRIKRDNKTSTSLQSYQTNVAWKLCDIANVFDRGHC